MEQPKSLTVFFFIFTATAMAAPASTTTQSYTNFIKASCNATTYPSLCTTTLLPYATAIKSKPLRLVKQALSTTLKSASTTRAAISKLANAKNITKGDAAVLKDCIDDIQDSIDEINDSLKAISSLGSSTNKKFVLSDAETWTSAAITDEDTCVDGFSGENISPKTTKKIRSSIVRIERLCSNALYLINHLKI